MIEKILSKIEELIMCNEEEANACYPSAMARESAYYECKEIVQEVAKDGGWIPVEERLPNWEIEEDYTENVHTVLQWWDGDITYGVGWYRKNFGWNEDGANCKVIAWKPIAPYQKGEPHE